MSWVWKANQRLRTPEQVMAVIIQTVDELGMPDKRGAAVCAGMCVAQESDFWCPWNAADPESKNYPYDSQSDDGRSVGYFQQQKGPDGALWWGPTSQEMDLHLSAREFLTRLKKVGYKASNAQAANDAVQAVQRSGVPQGYKKHWDRINDLYNRVVQNPQPAGEIVPDNRPDFQEFNEIGLDNGRHASVRSRPPMNFFVHTQEGGGGNSAATDLSAYLRSTSGSSAVSYHYTISQASDGGVTLVDVVDTDLYSWAVLNANVFSINLCFAGSRAAWSRDQWMQQKNAIRVAAYIAVQDAKKYNFSTEVIPPPYGAARAGISDHRYVTECLHIGSHTDVGGPEKPPWTGFPWDYFIDCVNEFTNNAPVVTQPVPVTPVPVADWPKSASDRDLLEYVAAQVGPGDPAWPSKGMTLRDKVWTLESKGA